MSVVPLTTSSYPHGQTESRMPPTRKPDLMRIGVGASLLAGSLLLLAGKRRPGLILTAAGTALAMLENRDIVSVWWEALPQYLDKAQNIIDQTQQTIDDLTVKRDKIFEVFGR